MKRLLGIFGVMCICMMLGRSVLRFRDMSVSLIDDRISELFRR